MKGDYVECVAPLLRGLKPLRHLLPHEVRRQPGRMRCPAIEGIETDWTSWSGGPGGRRRMRCPAIEGIETCLPFAVFGTKPILRRMRCPAIEGIETRSVDGRRSSCERRVECVAPLLRGLKPDGAAAGDRPDLRRVECVAPLLRGLKHLDGDPLRADGPRRLRRMRCPAIEGIETPRRDRADLRVRRLRRMRCPAIEGIETPPRRFRPCGPASPRVECVAPLLRGLKPPGRSRTRRRRISRVECVAPLLRGLKHRRSASPSPDRSRPGRMRCPAIEGIETQRRPLSRAAPDRRQVECVAPLLRGLKPGRSRGCGRPAGCVECVAPLLRGLKPGSTARPVRGRRACRRMRCPAIEGIETCGFRGPPEGRAAASRMRCPAIEGIETG